MEEEKKEIGIHVTPNSKPDVIIIGAGGIEKNAMLEEAIRVAEESGKKIAIVDDINKVDLEKTDFDLDKLAMPVYKYLSRLPIESIFDQSIFDQSIPNKLQLLRDLKLSPEQIDYFKNAPPHRLEGEKQEDYKTRRMLNKLIIKYRGEF